MVSAAVLGLYEGVLAGVRRGILAETVGYEGIWFITPWNKTLPLAVMQWNMKEIWSGHLKWLENVFPWAVKDFVSSLLVACFSHYFYSLQVIWFNSVVFLIGPVGLGEGLAKIPFKCLFKMATLAKGTSLWKKEMLQWFVQSMSLVLLFQQCSVWPLWALIGTDSNDANDPFHF